jgi:ATP/maltotriose-dependent transcriptional regulator MalT
MDQLLPDRLLRQRPLLWIYGAMVVNALGYPDKAGRMLHEIKGVLDDANRDERSAQDQVPLYQQISALQAVVDLQSENYTQGISLAMQAMTVLPESDSLMYGWLNHFLGFANETTGDLEASIASFSRGTQFSLQHKIPSGILSRCEIGRLRKMQGRMHEAEREYRRALDFAAENGLARETGRFCPIGVSRCPYRTNNLKLVDEWIKEIEISSRKPRFDRYGWTFALGLYARLANYYLFRDLKKSKLFIQKVRHVLKGSRPFFYFSPFTDLRVRIWLADGDLSAAHGWIEKRMSRLERGKELALAELIGLARIFLAQENPEAAYPSWKRLIGERGRRVRENN